MTATKPDWTVNKDIAVGKEPPFCKVATVGKAKFEMDAPGVKVTQGQWFNRINR